MTDGKDTVMKPVKPPRGYPSRNRRPLEAKFRQLIPGHDTVLAGRQLRDVLVT